MRSAVVYRTITVLAAALIASVSGRAEVNELYVERGIAHAQRIVEEFPPDRYYVMFLGVWSPPVSAAMQQITHTDGHEYFTEVPVEMLAESLRPDSRYQVIKAILPSADLLAGRQLAIVRTVTLGITLDAFLETYRDTVKPERPEEEKLGLYMIRDSLEEESVRRMGAFQDIVAKQVVADDDDFIDLLEEDRSAPDAAASYTAYRPFQFATPMQAWPRIRNPKRTALDRQIEAFLTRKRIDLAPAQARFQAGIQDWRLRRGLTACMSP